MMKALSVRLDSLHGKESPLAKELIHEYAAVVWLTYLTCINVIIELSRNTEILYLSHSLTRMLDPASLGLTLLGSSLAVALICLCMLLLIQGFFRCWYSLSQRVGLSSAAQSSSWCGRYLSSLQ